MSMHKIPLTEIEKAGLEAHGLARGIGKPNQAIDIFRQGVAWGLRQQLAEQTSAEPVLSLEVRLSKRGYKIDYIADVEDLDNLPDGEHLLYTAPPSVEVLLEALRHIQKAAMDITVERAGIAKAAANALSSYKPTEG